MIGRGQRRFLDGNGNGNVSEADAAKKAFRI